MFHPQDYDVALDHAAVLTSIVEIPQGIVDAAGRLEYDGPNKIVPQGVFGEEVNLYTLTGTIAPHTDDIMSNTESWITLGFVIINEPEAQLWTENGLLPLPPGSIYRINPNRMHGTCLADGTQTSVGRFVFLTCDMPADEEIPPRNFASWALGSAEARIMG